MFLQLRKSSKTDSFGLSALVPVHLWMARFAVIVTLLSFIFNTHCCGQVTVCLHSMVGADSLVLDTATYRNGLSQPYTVTMLRYYVSHLQIDYADGDHFSDAGYYLVDAREHGSEQIVLKGARRTGIRQISFLVGVDSLHNCSGAQSGALDPINGMFWTWNTGYIFFKMEGRSPSSSSRGGVFEFHIGGYKTPYNCLRTVHLNLENNSPGKDAATINIIADIGKMMAKPAPLDFSKTSSVTDFHGAMPMADRYYQMFYIDRDSR